MLKHLALAIGLSLAVCAPDAAVAHTAQAGALQVIHPWVSPAGKGATTVAKPTISNTGKEPVEITRAVSPAAEEIGLMLNGEAVETITIRPGETFTPEQIRFELHGLRVALPEGKGVPVTLRTRDGAALEIVLAIGSDTMNPEETVSAP